MSRRPRLGAGLVGCLALAVAWIGPARAAPEPPTFHLEEISVLGTARFSPEVVRAESRLEEGGVYSEEELAQAQRRIVRLPLVLDAVLSLERGSERGRYRLVIEVLEARRWFVGLDLDVRVLNEPVSVSGLTTTEVTTSSVGVVGRRFRAGPNGVWFVALGGIDGSLNAGYSHHDLWGRGIVGSVSYGFSDCGADRAEDTPSDAGDEGCLTDMVGFGLDPTFSTWTTDGERRRLRASVALPRPEGRTLRLGLSYLTSAQGLRRQALDPGQGAFQRFVDLEDLELAATWVDDDTDDPFFPTRGRVVERLASLRTLHGTMLTAGVTAETGNIDSAELGLGWTGRWHRPVSARDSVWWQAAGRVGAGEIEVPDLDGRPLDGSTVSWKARIGAGHARSLRSIRRQDRWSEWRWESDLELFASGSDPDFGASDNPRLGVRVGTGAALRTSWGVFRFRLSLVAGGSG